MDCQSTAEESMKNHCSTNETELYGIDHEKENVTNEMNLTNIIIELKMPENTNFV